MKRFITLAFLASLLSVGAAEAQIRDTTPDSYQGYTGLTNSNPDRYTPTNGSLDEPSRDVYPGFDVPQDTGYDADVGLNLDGNAVSDADPYTGRVAVDADVDTDDADTGNDLSQLLIGIALVLSALTAFLFYQRKKYGHL